MAGNTEMAEFNLQMETWCKERAEREDGLIAAMLQINSELYRAAAEFWNPDLKPKGKPERSSSTYRITKETRAKIKEMAGAQGKTCYGTLDEIVDKVYRESCP